MDISAILEQARRDFEQGDDSTISMVRESMKAGERLQSIIDRATDEGLSNIVSHFCEGKWLGYFSDEDLFYALINRHAFAEALCVLFRFPGFVCATSFRATYTVRDFFRWMPEADFLTFCRSHVAWSKKAVVRLVSLRYPSRSREERDKARNALLKLWPDDVVALLSAVREMTSDSPDHSTRFDHWDVLLYRNNYEGLSIEELQRLFVSGVQGQDEVLESIACFTPQIRFGPEETADFVRWASRQNGPAIKAVCKEVFFYKGFDVGALMSTLLSQEVWSRLTRGSLTSPTLLGDIMMMHGKHIPAGTLDDGSVENLINAYVRHGNSVRRTAFVHLFSMIGDLERYVFSRRVARFTGEKVSPIIRHIRDLIKVTTMWSLRAIVVICRSSRVPVPIEVFRHIYSMIEVRFLGD